LFIEIRIVKGSKIYENIFGFFKSQKYGFFTFIV
jgi:hypothetical protein